MYLAPTTTPLPRGPLAITSLSPRPLPQDIGPPFPLTAHALCLLRDALASKGSISTAFACPAPGLPVLHYNYGVGDGDVFTLPSSVAAAKHPVPDTPPIVAAPSAKADVISISSNTSGSSSDDSLELLYPSDGVKENLAPPIILDVLTPVRLVVFINNTDPPTLMTVYPREAVRIEPAALYLEDYRDTLLAIGFNTAMEGKVYMESLSFRLLAFYFFNIPSLQVKRGRGRPPKPVKTGNAGRPQHNPGTQKVINGHRVILRTVSHSNGARKENQLPEETVDDAPRPLRRSHRRADD
ncbi:hypothetical protein C8R45DRAFT_1152136 [Mycena sanguinolenta]|nr:hypothetical protein C8R45DRAFT_1152136 [Mycena sanguinolenta]